jgi:manganese transport protein
VSVAKQNSDVVSSAEQSAIDVLEGTSSRRGLRRILPFMGPAFVACVAYIDPGNFATNIAAGAEFGYNLLWVVVYANIMAMVIQTLSAKLGIATGKNLPEMIRAHFPCWLVWPLWILAEIMAMATDLAEFTGAAVGFNLLFGIPLFVAACLTGISTFCMLYLQQRGFRPLEALITVFVLVVAACYVVELFLGHPNPSEMAYHALVPFIAGNTLMLTAGILGATVMPHVVYLHSALLADRVRPRTVEQARRLFRFTVVDIFLALPLAGVVNGGMLVMAAVTFHEAGTKVTDLATAYHTLDPLLGRFAATVFAVSLLASGLSSSTVGTLAGQVIMQGFVNFRISLWVRRAVTMAPSFVVIALNLPTATALIVSQVVLSIVLAFAVVPLVLFTSRRAIMGALVNHRFTTAAGWACASVIIALNALLIYRTFGGPLPGAD